MLYQALRLRDMQMQGKLAHDGERDKEWFLLWRDAAVCEMFEVMADLSRES